MSTGLTPLTAPTEARIQHIGSAEILVGIPSYNNADTVGHVVRAISVGLAKHFPGRRAVLVNSDGGSSDGRRPSSPAPPSISNTFSSATNKASCIGS